MRKSIQLIIYFSIIIVISSPAKAEDKMNFAVIDSLSYQQYLEGDWQGLLETAEQALENDIDYYYLRMRAGWALYSLQKYRQAIPHYRKALDFNSGDPVATEMLAYCYAFGGRKNDTYKLMATLPKNQYKDLFSGFGSGVTSFSIFTTWNESRSGNAIAEIYDFEAQPIEGIQKVPVQYAYTTLGFTHKLGKGAIMARHNLGLLNRSEFSLAINDEGLELPMEDQPVLQVDYHLALDYTPFQGIKISPSVYYSYSRVPLYLLEDYRRGNRAPQRAFDYYETSATSWSLKSDIELGLFSAGASFAMGAINYFDVTQLGLHGKTFPLGNLNLYYTGNVWWQQKKTAEGAHQQIIHQHHLGFRVTPWLWMELETMQGEVNSFIDTDNGLVYNNLETLHQSYQTSGIFILRDDKINLQLGVKYGSSSSNFYPAANPLDYLNETNFTFLNFTGGIIWKF